jgi:hypothetical protein
VATKQQQVMINREKKNFCYLLIDLMGAEKAKEALLTKINQLSDTDNPVKFRMFWHIIAYAEMLSFVNDIGNE